MTEPIFDIQDIKDTMNSLHEYTNNKRDKKIVKKSTINLPKQKGSKNMLTVMEELQELNIEIQKYICNLPSQNKDHLTEEFADVVLCTRFMQSLYKYKTKELIQDIKPSALGDEILKETDDIIILSLTTYIFSNMAKAVSKVMRGKETKDFLIPYIHDTEIALCIIQRIFDISECEIKKHMHAKLLRQKIRNKTNTNQ